MELWCDLQLLPTVAGRIKKKMQLQTYNVTVVWWAVIKKVTREWPLVQQQQQQQLCWLVRAPSLPCLLHCKQWSCINIIVNFHWMARKTPSLKGYGVCEVEASCRKLWQPGWVFWKQLFNQHNIVWVKNLPWTLKWKSSSGLCFPLVLNVLLYPQPKPKRLTSAWHQWVVISLCFHSSFSDLIMAAVSGCFTFKRPLCYDGWRFALSLVRIWPFMVDQRCHRS